MNENNLLNLCRLCLSKNITYINLLSEEENEKSKILQKLATFFPFLIENTSENIDLSNSTSKVICLSCRDIVTNFYDFHRMVLSNQSYFLELTNKVKLNDSDEPQDEPRFLFTLKSNETVSLINTFENLEYSVEPDDGEKQHIPEREHLSANDEQTSDNGLTSSEIVHDHLGSTICDNTDDQYDDDGNDDIVTTSLNEESIVECENDQTDCIDSNVTLFSRKKIDELLPDHLKVRTSKQKSDAQIKEFVNLACDICKNSSHFDSFKELQEHFKLKHNQRGYVDCCDKKFYRKDRLLNHITNHIYPDAFKCTTCGQNSKSKILLRIHMKQHLPTALRPFQCPYKTCTQKFVLKSQLTNHEASHFTQDQKKFICDTCGKAFAMKFVMIKHKLTHSKEKVNFVCEICAKHFCSKTNLQSHMAHHSHEKSPRIQCSFCNLWYKNVETLRTHQQRHKDHRQHICNICSKECTTGSSLSAHIRYVHLKVKDFECNVCNKKFRRKLELIEHTARHTGQVLYTCPFCPKTFTSSSNYFSHRKYRHASQLAEGLDPGLQTPFGSGGRQRKVSYKFV